MNEHFQPSFLTDKRRNRAESGSICAPRHQRPQGWGEDDEGAYGRWGGGGRVASRVRRGRLLPPGEWGWGRLGSENCKRTLLMHAVCNKVWHSHFLRVSQFLFSKQKLIATHRDIHLYTVGPLGMFGPLSSHFLVFYLVRRIS
jgi:hypothetical protein